METNLERTKNPIIINGNVRPRLMIMLRISILKQMKIISFLFKLKVKTNKLYFHISCLSSLCKCDT